MKKLSILIYFLILSVGLSAQENKIFQTKDGAISGYDAVAYFTENKPVKGNINNVYEYEGAKWYFISKENLNKFKANPNKYKPEYGGYCAYGYADGDGHAAPTSPDAFSVVNNKLYLNYNTDVKNAWSKNQPALIKKADENYKKAKDKKQ